MGRNEAMEKLKTIIDDAMAEQDIVHKIATAIRQKNDPLIVNLSSLR